MSYKCILCPRNCQVDRTFNLGFCKVPNDFVIARAAPHYWEEPILSGEKGSGTIFFSGCTMACCFCQNHSISSEVQGRIVQSAELIEVMLSLQDQGCHNIQFVTADHYLNRLPDVILSAKNQGLRIPIALNTSSYVHAGSLIPLEGLIDIYLPDLKYYSDRYAMRYSATPAYFKTAVMAIQEMFRQVGSAVLTKEGLLRQGLLIRHLVLPGLHFDSKKILRYIHKTYGNKVFVSVMNQYTPMFRASDHPEINRPPSEREYEVLLTVCDELGFERGFVQAERAVDESLFVPKFDGTGLPSSAPEYQHKNKR